MSEKMADTYDPSPDEQRYAAYLDHKLFIRRCAPIQEEIRAAIGTYMDALDDPRGKSTALRRLDAALRRLREEYREEGYRWDGWGICPPPMFGFYGTVVDFPAAGTSELDDYVPF